MKLDLLLKDLQVIEITGDTDREVTNVCYDSRKSGIDSLFVAIKGVQVDGHEFINDVLKKGAKVIVCETFNYKDVDTSDLTIVLVKNSRKALASISNNWYKSPLENMKVIGVTGTNGKTTTTYLLKAIFDEAGYKTGVIGTTGIFIGNEKIPATHTTPESLELFEHFHQMKERSVEIVIMEVSSHSLHQNRVFGVNFDAALFTNITHEHLDYHKTIVEYAKAKKILFDNLDEDSIAIVNGDDEFGSFMLNDIKAYKKIMLGRKENNDIIIFNEVLGINESKFNLQIASDKQLNIKIPLAGRFNIDNCAIAAVTAFNFGIDDSIICNTLKHCQGAPGRMQRITLNNGAVGIVDYSHTPDALEKALNACTEIINISGYNSKLICVFGCGGDRDKTKRPLMGEISSRIADFVIITDDNPRTEDPKKIIDEIYEGVNSAGVHKVKIIPNREEAIKHTFGISEQNDIILIAGKGHEDYQIYGNEKFHFDDVEQLEKYA